MINLLIERARNRYYKRIYRAVKREKILRKAKKELLKVQDMLFHSGSTHDEFISIFHAIEEIDRILEIEKE